MTEFENLQEKLGHVGAIIVSKPALEAMIKRIAQLESFIESRGYEVPE